MKTTDTYYHAETATGNVLMCSFTAFFLCMDVCARVCTRRDTGKDKGPEQGEREAETMGSVVKPSYI